MQGVVVSCRNEGTVEWRDNSLLFLCLSFWRTGENIKRKRPHTYKATNLRSVTFKCENLMGQFGQFEPVLGDVENIRKYIYVINPERIELPYSFELSFCRTVFCYRRCQNTDHQQVRIAKRNVALTMHMVKNTRPLCHQPGTFGEEVVTKKPVT